VTLSRAAWNYDGKNSLSFRGGWEKCIPDPYNKAGGAGGRIEIRAERNVFLFKGKADPKGGRRLTGIGWGCQNTTKEKTGHLSKGVHEKENCSARGRSEQNDARLSKKTNDRSKDEGASDMGRERLNVLEPKKRARGWKGVVGNWGGRGGGGGGW